MDQDATWYGGRPQPRPHCVRWGPSSPRKWHSSPSLFLAHVYCGQTFAHLSCCCALVSLNSCVCTCLQCSDTVDGHQEEKSTWPVKIKWWADGVVICLEQYVNDLHMVQLISWCHCIPSSLALLKSRLALVLAYAVVTCAIIACNTLQFLHAIIAGFQTCSKIFMRPKCCSQWQRLVESRDVVLVLMYMWRNRVYCLSLTNLPFTINLR